MESTRRMARPARAGLAASALALLACQPTQNAGTGTELGNVIGRVAYAGQPAAGAEVILYPADGDTARVLRTLAGEDGGFGFHADPGVYNVIALDGEGRGVMVDSIRSADTGRVDLATQDLVPLGSLAGHARVTGHQGHPVSLSLPGTPFTHAFEPGDFEWEGIPAGRYWLRAYYPGAGILERPLRIKAGETTVIPDTLDLVFGHSHGPARSDTLLLAHLPHTVFDKILTPREEYDTAYWVLGGTPVVQAGSDGVTFQFSITRDMLPDTGVEALELRVVSGDSVYVRRWWVGLSPEGTAPYPAMAVRGILLDKRPNPRQDPAARDLGTFQILDSRRLADEELVFWGWDAVGGPDPVLPDILEAPVDETFAADHLPCGESENDWTSIRHLPGDTLTFFLIPDAESGTRAFRFRKDEAWEDVGKGAWAGRADWPLMAMRSDPGSGYRGRLEPSYRAEGPSFLWTYDWTPFGGPNCVPLLRRYLVDEEGTVRETLATPAGIESAELLLHYRVDLSEGLVTDSLPRRGSWIYLAEDGNGMAGRGDSSWAIQVEPADLAALRDALAGLPAIIPRAWEADAFPAMSKTTTAAAAGTSRYLHSLGRGTIEHPGEPGTPADKAALFEAVEAWLAARSLP
jgi:hypothetical protein